MAAITTEPCFELRGTARHCRAATATLRNDLVPVSSRLQIRQRGTPARA
jgi:hypothetical protein